MRSFAQIFGRRAVLSAFLLAGPFAISARAANFTVGTNADSGPGSLRQAIADSNTAGGTNTITLTTGLATILLAADLPPVQANVTILGNDNTLDGDRAFRGFFIGAWATGTATMIPVAVTIQDLTIQNAKAQGGTGFGGGAGLGGAVFIADLASVTLSNVNLSANNATGGTGGIGFGGGGMGGNGGDSGFSDGGGGLGIGAQGGNVGSAGSPGIAIGASSAGAGGSFTGGPVTLSGKVGGIYGGGGGGGNNVVGYFASGGGGGGVGGFAGGGGNGITNGGDGGFGGGGGSGGAIETGSGIDFMFAGNGGFGGGGGNASAGGFTGGVNGSGGFGGGAGGFGGGNGPGGGAGMGGSLFVQQGGLLTLSGPLTVNGGSVTAGISITGGGNGSAFGTGLFIQGNGTVTFSPGTGQTQTFSDEIADQTGNGGTAGNAGAGGLIKNGAGTLILAGANSYTGATTINAGTLLVNGSLAAGSAVTVASGGTLGGSGTVNGSATVSAGGLVAPGNGMGALSVGGSFTWNGSTDGSAAMQFELGNSDSTSDQLAIAGALTKGAAGTFKFDFQGSGHSAGTYTLATFGSTTFSGSDFGYANLPMGLTGSFAIVGGSKLQFTVNPSLVTVASGRTAVFSAPAAGSPASTYQWSFNGTPISGATDRLLAVTAAGSANAGSYTCTATNSSGSFAIASATLTVVSASNSGRLINLSARANVGTGNNILIGGFGVGGAGTKQLLVRGTGPALSPYLGNDLANPQLVLLDNTGAIVGTSIGWGNAPAAGTSTAAEAPAAAGALLQNTLGAFPYGAGSADTAMVLTMPAGNNTAQLSGVGGTSGIALCEIYDADAGTPPARLVNLSARADVGAGNNILIGGFAIGGSTAETVLIRAVGPGLNDQYPATFPLATVLNQPVLTILDNSGAVIYSNTVWGGDPAIAAAITSTGAFALNPAHADSALLVTLPPGNYTAQVSGLNGGTGIALVEVYEEP